MNSIYTGAGEAIATCCVAAAIISRYASNTIAACLVPSVITGSKAALKPVVRCACGEGSGKIDLVAVRISRIFIAVAGFRGLRVDLATATEGCHSGFLATNTVSVNTTWAWNVQALHSSY